MLRVVAHQWPLLFVAVSCLNCSVLAQTTQVVMLVGEATPDGGGTFEGVGNTVLNGGQVGFLATLVGPGGGLFRVGDEPATIVSWGDPVPVGSGTFESTFGQAITSAGMIAFRAGLTDTDNGSDDDFGIFLGDGNSITQIVREGQETSDGNGAFYGFGQFSLNNVNEVAFWGYLNGSTGDTRGLFRSNGLSLTEIVLNGDLSPDGDGTFTCQLCAGAPAAVRNAALNDAGQVAFAARLFGSSGGFSNDSGIFRGDGTTLVKIVREGDSAPEGGVFPDLATLTRPVINGRGQVAFYAALGGVPASMNEGIFLGDGITMTQIVREGQPAPDGNGTLGNFAGSASTFVVVNNLGQVAFRGRMNGTDMGVADDLGIFRSDGTTMTQVAREGQVTPDGASTFTAFGIPSINSSGQVTFFGYLADGGHGIYLFDDGAGLQQVVRSGQLLLGSTITGVGQGGNSTEPLSEQDSGLDDQGRVVFTFGLVDGRQGIAIWSLPSASCPADVDNDQSVGVSDLLDILNEWGACSGPCPPYCSQDIDENCDVGITDLLEVLGHWGACP